MADQIENTVETLLAESAADDAQQAQGESLSAMIEEPAQEAPQQAEERKEPGYVKGRINAAVQKAVAEAEARIRQEYEAMLAPIRESVLERQAQQLVDSGEVKTLEMAKEYVRMKGGLPTPQSQSPSQQNRDSQGRFTPQAEKTQEDPAAHAKADMLAKQAQKIKANRGLDVMRAFNDNPEYKQKVLSGEWDFYDVAEAMGQGNTEPTVAVRSPNEGQVGAASIAGMSDKQFAQLQANLAAGRVVNLRK